MTAEGAIEFEALERSAALLLKLFAGAGYERVAPAFIQPASLFLDRIGEALRVRTYVFTDPNGEELCLRPEMTIPVCRVFLERGNGQPGAKYCYNGPAFRIQDGKPDPLRPREFRQAGIERFGAAGQGADLEVIGLTIEGMRQNGVKNFTLRVGHIGLFQALLGAIEMPQRWRDRLARAFWRSGPLSKELAALSNPERRGGAAVLYDGLTEDRFLKMLDSRGIAFIGLRRPAEIVQRLQERAADQKEPPLPQASVRLLQAYLRQSGAMNETLGTLQSLFAAEHLRLEAALEEVWSLHSGLSSIVGENTVIFDAAFGRHFEYYTGMVFQIERADEGAGGHIAGGGRYDGLIRALTGGERDTPAVGAAIHTERMLAASWRSNA